MLVEYEKTLQSLKGLEELDVDPLDERSFEPATRIVSINRDDREMNINPRVNPLSPSANIGVRPSRNLAPEIKEAEGAPSTVASE